MPNILIKKPVITEKSVTLADHGRYVFVVDSRADKRQVAEAVAAAFNVTVKAVNIINLKGKVKNFRRHAFSRSNIKKAIVQLMPGQKINMFEES